MKEQEIYDSLIGKEVSIQGEYPHDDTIRDVKVYQIGSQQYIFLYGNNPEKPMIVCTLSELRQMLQRKEAEGYELSYADFYFKDIYDEN